MKVIDQMTAFPLFLEFGERRQNRQSNWLHNFRVELGGEQVPLVPDHRSETD